MTSERRYFWGKYREVIIVALLFTFIVLFGWFYLHLPGIKVIADAEGEVNALAPALLWAMGYGMSFTLFTGETPETRAFIRQERDSLAPSEMLPPLVKIPATGKFFRDRRYTLYTVAVLWRIFGVSYDVLKGLLAFMFAMIAVLSYGIFRLGMNRGLSLAGTLLTMFSPGMLFQLPWLRSLGKAPFILGAALAAGYLLSRPMRRTPFLLLSALLGLVMGYGMGFRQDVTLCLPPLLAAMCFGVQGTRPIGWPWRLCGAALLCGICYAVQQIPTSDQSKDEIGNNSFYLTQGFASCSRGSAEMDMSAIRPVYSNADFAVQGQVEHYACVQPDRACKKGVLQWFRDYSCAKAASDLIALAPLSAISNVILYNGVDFYNREGTSVGMWSDEAELVTRGMVRYLYLTFPADVIGRCYGSAFRIIRNLDHGFTYEVQPVPVLSAAAPLLKALAAHLHEYGLLYAGAALAILAGIRLRFGFAALLLLFYFCGYTGIQFQTRHAFHLNLFSFWAPLFLLGVAGHAARVLFQAAKTHSVKTYLSPAYWRAPLRRVLIFGAVAVFMFAASLYPARLWQYVSTGRLLDQFQHAGLEPLPFHVADSDAGPIYCPDRLPNHETPFDPLSSLYFPQVDKREFTPEYMAADVTANSLRSSVAFRYVNPTLSLDGYEYYETGGVTSEPRTFRFFFPAYHMSERAAGANRENQSRDFKGIELGPEMSLKALYRVRNLDEFPVLMCVWLPLDGEPVRRCDRLPAFWGP